jgi:hypothetical protein
MATVLDAETAGNATNLPDRAIVVGIGCYSRYGAGKPNNLAGPVADATAVADWLAGSAGAHVTLLTSNGGAGQPWTVSDLRPETPDLKREFDKLVIEAVMNGNAGRPSRLARRLYVYMAGHGFMPDHNELALVTAESIDPGFVQSLQVTAWVDWFSDQYHFDELVLWMDCCARRDYYQPSLKPLMRKEAARNGDPAKMFVAFAAKPTRDAFEAQLPPDNEVRGIFTSRLLTGLRGAAADEQGHVTTASLMGYLNGSGLVGEEVTSTLHGAARPDHYFPRHDPLIFAEVANTPSYRLHVPLADGTRVTILDGRKEEVATEIVADGIVTVILGSGLYKAEGPGFSHLFEIAAGTETDVPLN